MVEVLEFIFADWLHYFGILIYLVIICGCIMETFKRN